MSRPHIIMSQGRCEVRVTRKEREAYLYDSGAFPGGLLSVSAVLERTTGVLGAGN